MNIIASIIIPTANRAASLSVTLRSLAALNTSPGQFEIIVVDNGSIDNTREIVNEFAEKNPQLQLQYFYDAVPGLLTGRHRGAAEANGSILVFIDDDIIADPQWLNAIITSFEDPLVHIVGGKNLPLYEATPPEWLEKFWVNDHRGHYCGWLSLCDLGDEIKEIDPNFVWGLNFAIRKKTLYELGGFHPDCIPSDLQQFQGDGETGLTLKAKEKGYKALYHPGAMVQHVVPPERLSAGYFEKRAFYQGVCDSYTAIRKNGEIKEGTEIKNAGNENSGKRSLNEKLKNFFRKKNVPAQDTYEIIVAKTRDAYARGYAFHTRAAKESRSLLSWILKDDYFNYELPTQKISVTDEKNNQKDR